MAGMGVVEAGGKGSAQLRTSCREVVLMKLPEGLYHAYRPARGAKALRVLFAIFAVFFLLISAALAEDADVGFVSKLEGKVDILRAGAKEAVSLKGGEKVFIGDIIRTKHNSKAEVTFKDKTVVKLAPESRVKVDEYLFDADGSRKKGSLFLFRGKVRGAVSTFKKKVIPVASGASTFDIQTPTAIAGVRGTDFFVFYTRGISGVVFAEGLGFVYNPNLPAQIVDIRGGQSTLVPRFDAPPLPPRKASETELIRHASDTDIKNGANGKNGKEKEEGSEVPLEYETSAIEAGSDSTEGEDSVTSTEEKSLVGDGAAEEITEESDIPVTESNTDILGVSGGPVVTVSSKPSRTEGTSTASFLISYDEPVDLSCTIDGVTTAYSYTNYELIEVADLSEGTHTITLTATDYEGNTSTETYSWFFGARRAILEGYVGGTSLDGSAAGAISLYSYQDSGGWFLDMSGYSNGPLSGSWGARAGGTIGIAGGTGYWQASAGGTYSSGSLSGTSQITILTTSYLGTGTGSVDGTYDETSGYWEAEAYELDTYAATPLTFVNPVGDIDGNLEALMGGTEAIWSADEANPAGVTLIGYYNPDDSSSTFLSEPFFGLQYISFGLSTVYTTYDGGAYHAFIGGYDNNGSISGSIYGLYIDPFGNAGILRGSLSGSAYADIYTLYLTGGAYPVQMDVYSSVTYTANDFSAGVRNFRATSANQASVSGSFDAGGSITSIAGDNYWHYMSSRIDGQDWGTWYNFGKGSYSGSMSSGWSLTSIDLGFDSFTQIIGSETTGSTWSNGALYGTTLGYGASWKTQSTWISAGETFGVYDPAAYAWQAVQTGAWIETNKFLTMTGTAEGQASLASLNIPYAEIGRATLTGTDGNLSVTMTDVIFFAYSSSDVAPKIWATNSISGSYAADPSIGNAVSVTGGGLSANFTVKQWSGNYWMSTVSGSGTYSGTGAMNGSSVQMDGAAAGTYSTGSFSGTGAGTAK